MQRRGQGLASNGIVVLAVLTALAGLALTGGPMEGRREHRDNTRMEDLTRIAQNVECAAGLADGRLPDAPGTADDCPDPLRLNDPFTGAAYTYMAEPPDVFRLCAVFERPARLVQPWRTEYDAASGCIVRRIHRPDRAAGAPQPDVR